MGLYLETYEIWREVNPLILNLPQRMGHGGTRPCKVGKRLYRLPTRNLPKTYANKWFKRTPRSGLVLNGLRFQRAAPLNPTRLPTIRQPVDFPQLPKFGVQRKNMVISIGCYVASQYVGNRLA